MLLREDAISIRNKHYLVMCNANLLQVNYCEEPGFLKTIFLITIGFISSPCPSVRMYQRASPLKNSMKTDIGFNEKLLRKS
jgi:hypothetical protein